VKGHVQRYVRLLVWCARVRRAHVCFVRVTLTFFCRIAHDRAPSNVPSHGPARSAVRPSGARACLRACSAASLSAAAPYLADEPGAVEVRPAKTYECACAQALRRGCVDASGGICSRPSRGSRAGSPTLQRNMVLHRRDARWFGRDESSVRPAKMDEEQRTSYVRVLSALGLLSPLWSAAGAAGSAGPDVVRERRWQSCRTCVSSVTNGKEHDLARRASAIRPHPCERDVFSAGGGRRQSATRVAAPVLTATKSRALNTMVPFSGRPNDCARAQSCGQTKRVLHRTSWYRLACSNRAK
jgi:hypothetical protein